jgi:cell division protein FtsI/penicillin-binding protein 2
MITAASAIANDGKMMTPHVVLATVKDGQRIENTPQVLNAPISAETAHTLNEMLAVSLEEEASKALVPGYRIAGKTGTAQIAKPDGSGYDEKLINASFVGWGPVDDPQFIVYVWIQEPNPEKGEWGSTVAAPVFKQVVQRLVILMNIPPDQIRLGEAAVTSTPTETP